MTIALAAVIALFNALSLVQLAAQMPRDALELAIMPLVMLAVAIYAGWTMLRRFDGRSSDIATASLSP